MRIVEEEFWVACDVDNTLIMHDATFDLIKIINPHDGAIHWVGAHKRHVELLRQYKARGMSITVWSNNGVRWAEAVVKAVGLDDGTVDEVRTKYIKHMDDQTDAANIVGSYVYIPYKENT